MNMRFVSAIVAAVGAFAVCATGAEARIHQSNDAAASTGRASIAKNYTGKSSKRYAKSSSRKSYAKAGSKKRHYASKKRNLKSRSFTNYASGGTSRSCLQPQARALLNRIESQFGSVSIVSTCRAGAVIATSGKPSKHRYGLAIDFDAGGRKGAIVNWLLKNHHSGGTMTYRDMSHIHVDIGPRFVSLGANSGRT